MQYRFSFTTGKYRDGAENYALQASLQKSIKEAIILNGNESNYFITHTHFKYLVILIRVILSVMVC